MLIKVAAPEVQDEEPVQRLVVIWGNRIRRLEYLCKVFGYRRI